MAQTYDDWKTGSSDPGRLRHPVKYRFVCTQCPWEGSGYQARFDHHAVTHHQIVHETAHAIWCDWCEKYIDVGKEVLANHGGRFCSDECATLWAEGERVGDITGRTEA